MKKVKGSFFLNRSAANLLSAFCVYLVYFTNRNAFDDFLVQHTQVFFYTQVFTLGMPPVIQTLLVKKEISREQVVNFILLVFVLSILLIIVFLNIFSLSNLFWYVPILSLYYNLLAMETGGDVERRYFNLLWFFGLTLLLGSFLAYYSIYFVYLPLSVYTLFYLIKSYNYNCDRVNLNIRLFFNNGIEILAYYTSNIGFKNIPFYLTFILSNDQFLIFKLVYSAGTYLWNLFYNLLFQQLLSLQSSGNILKMSALFDRLYLLKILLIFGLIFYSSNLLIFNSGNIYLMSILVALTAVVVNLSNSLSYSLRRSSKRVLTDILVAALFALLNFSGLFTFNMASHFFVLVFLGFLLILKSDLRDEKTC